MIHLWLSAFIGLLIPFMMTSFGAALVFLLRPKRAHLWQKICLGFAAGIMTASAVFSLLLPAMEEAAALEQTPWLSVLSGFGTGVLFLLLFDSILPHIHPMGAHAEGIRVPWSRSTLLFFAVTLHNIPEGMAVGVVFAGMLAGNAQITLMGAFALSIGIAIQNFPEGAIISMPLQGEGVKKSRAFVYGMLSGVVEPAAGGITLLLAGVLTPVLPWLLSFAAGAMIYVVVEELIPEASEGKHSNIGTIGFALGFVLMMVLDTALG